MNVAAQSPSDSPQEASPQAFFTEQDCLRGATVNFVLLIGAVALSIALQSGAMGYSVLASLLGLSAEIRNYTRIRRGIPLPKPAKKTPRPAKRGEILLGFVIALLLSAGTIWMTTSLLAALHSGSLLRSICAVIGMAYLWSALPMLVWLLVLRELPAVKARRLKAANAKVIALNAGSQVATPASADAKPAHWWTDTPLREEVQQIRR